MSRADAPLVRLVAGRWGDELEVSGPHGDDPRWFEPLHVKDPAAARGRIRDQVGAGADVVLAPVWRTHRRALVAVGEARRAQEWTLEAVRRTREGVEVGLERRDAGGAGDDQDESADPMALDIEEADGRVPAASLERPAVLVAGVLPELDVEPEPGLGRLLPRSAAGQRDYVAESGILADAAVDLILVAGQRTLEGARIALESAAATGLPVWAACPLVDEPSGLVLPDGTPLDAWAQMGAGSGATCLLGDWPASEADGAGTAAALARALGALDGTCWGASISEPQREDEGGRGPIGDLLDAGATVLGLADRATPERLRVVRRAMDARLIATHAVREAGWTRWRTVVDAAASMTEGGHAVWVGPRIEHPLPTGFDWLVVDAPVVPLLPREHYRLVIDASGSGTSMPLDGLLAGGGVCVMVAPEAGRLDRGLRILRIDAGEPTLAILRRDPS